MRRRDQGSLGRIVAALAVAVVLVVVLPAVADAATVSVQDGVLRYTAAAGEHNAPTFGADSDFFTVSDPSVLITHGPGCLVGAPSHTVACDRAAATSARADLGDLADTLNVDATMPLRVVAHGGDGDDVLRGGAHADTLTGDGANDKLDGRGGGDGLLGGAGSDTADYSSRTSNVRVTLDNVTNDGEDSEDDNVHADVEKVIGGAGSDTLIGDGAANSLIGGGGNDLLQGLGGADTLDGGAGTVNTVTYEEKTNPLTVSVDGAANDGIANEHDNVRHVQIIFGGAAADILVGNGGTNMIYGGPGNDTLRGLGGNDILFGEKGADVLDGGDGTGDEAVYSDATAGVFASNDGVANDGVSDDGVAGERDNVEPSIENITGGPFDDHLIGNDSANVLAGGTGNDRLEARGAADQLQGGGGDDWITGDDGNDTVKAGAGNDTVLLGNGNDLAQWAPGDGDDTVEGREDADTLQLNGSSAGGESIALSSKGGRLQLTDGGEVNDVDGVETVDVRPEGGQDQVTVDDLTDTDVNNANIDLAGIPGGSAADGEHDSVTVNGTAAADSAQVATGSGKVHVSGLAAHVAIAHTDSSDQLAVFPLAGDDRIAAGYDIPKLIDLQIQGGPDTDTVVARGTNGNDAILASSNAPFVRVASTLGHFTAITENLEIDGLGGSDDINGVSGLAALPVALTLDGGDGDDTIGGGDGNDTLTGGSGNDTVDGNLGDDIAALGPGNDRFVHDSGDGTDKAEGQGDTDTLQANGSSADETLSLFAAGDRLAVAQVGAITMDFGGIENVEINPLSGADTLNVNDLGPAGVTSLRLDLAATLGGSTGDGQADKVAVFGTDGDDAFGVTGDATNGVTVTGQQQTISIKHPQSANDQLRINTGNGADTVDFSGLAPNTIQTFQT